MTDALTIAYYDGGRASEANEIHAGQWRRRLESAFAGAQVVSLTAPEAEDAVAAMVWKPPPGRLAELTKLRAIISLGHGVDHLLSDPALPAGAPVIRLVDAEMAHTMSHWVIMVLLSHIRQAPEYRAMRTRREFYNLQERDPRTVVVGVYGVGEIGAVTARRVAALGFQTHGWARRDKQISGLACHTGDDGWRQMLRQCNVHICLLPLTAATREIFNRDAFAAMPQGSYFINAGRGGHVVEADLLAAIKAGHLAGAALDVFQQEPLPPEHPFWDCPEVNIWPHVAAQTNPESAAAQVITAIRLTLDGQSPPHQVDRARGY